VTFVLDASVTLGWLFPDDQDMYPERILQRLEDEPALVSQVWPLEIANGLLVAGRRGRISSADASLVRARLKDLPIRTDSPSLDAALGPVATLARTHNLTAYDASYLELAMREGVPLATIDERLRTAALASGVPLAE
jgi:predicted nucleic acid-binding protein